MAGDSEAFEIRFLNDAVLDAFLAIYCERVQALCDILTRNPFPNWIQTFPVPRPDNNVYNVGQAFRDYYGECVDLQGVTCMLFYFVDRSFTPQRIIVSEVLV